MQYAHASCAETLCMAEGGPPLHVHNYKAAVQYAHASCADTMCMAEGGPPLHVHTYKAVVQYAHVSCADTMCIAEDGPPLHVHNYKAGVQYEGTDFVGWQLQNRPGGKRSVQAVRIRTLPERALYQLIQSGLGKLSVQVLRICTCHVTSLEGLMNNKDCIGD